MSTDAFIPEGYEAPTGGGGFTKLEAGDNTLRILSNPFMMWLSWTDGKPSRLPYIVGGKITPKPAKGSGQKDSVKHAWGLIVWNYKTEQVEVFELDKQDIIGGLTAYAKNPKWGHPKHYDVVINKTGSGMDTEYKLVVEPKTEPSQQIVDAFIANPVDLTQLLVEGGNPFIDTAAANSAPVQAQTVPVQTPTQTPTATPQQAFDPPAGTGDPNIDNWVAGQPIPEGYVDNGAGGIKKKMPF